MTPDQVTRLNLVTQYVTNLHKELYDHQRDTWGDGTNPDLTLALEVSALGTAKAHLKLTQNHHRKRHL
jgi:hypothetical protein